MTYELEARPTGLIRFIFRDDSKHGFFVDLSPTGARRLAEGVLEMLDSPAPPADEVRLPRSVVERIRRFLNDSARFAIVLPGGEAFFRDEVIAVLDAALGGSDGE